ncbi:HNH endonuclease, partial [Gordonia terrae]
HVRFGGAAPGNSLRATADTTPGVDTNWADGGPTDLDNGCLLCQRCHTQVHHHSWQVVMGPDRHPWLIPPVDIDPKRLPRPAYNRRTMRLDDALV